MSTPFVGEMRAVSFGFAPRGWAVCDGQILPIASNQTLFALLGTQYGGDGVRTFALPDLRGRVGIGASGTHPQGQAGGEAAVTLTVAQMPSHSHAAQGLAAKGTQASPTGGLWAEDSGGAAKYAATATVTMAASAIGPAGGSAAHVNMQPTLGLTWIIALQGLFPSRT